MSESRLRSIDILRALTMLLMIFVNDLWTLENIPGWLEHKAAEEDGLGLADVVFPAFLFIVGLSIPHAIRSRLRKGHKKIWVIRHIFERTLALWIMGLMMVNLEYMDQGAIWMNKQVWQILMTLGFFLIWNRYPDRQSGPIRASWLKAAGWGLLIFLAIIYRDPGEAGSSWMRFHWWGILGLIGWGYLLAALVYLYLGQRPLWMGIIFLLLLLLNVNESHSLLPFNVRLVVSASNYASVMAGVAVTSMMIWLKDTGRWRHLLPLCLGFALLLIGFAFLSRPLWGISKIMATPSWTALCTGISILAFVLMHILADRMGIYRWAEIIEAAGTSTLTCYLLPFYIYAIAHLSGWSLPDTLTTGMIGILKSLVFSLAVIQLCSLLKRLNIQLKI